MLITNGAVVKSESLYPITGKKQLQAQGIVIENHLAIVYLIDSERAFLPLQVIIKVMN